MHLSFTAYLVATGVHQFSVLENVSSCVWNGINMPKKNGDFENITLVYNLSLETSAALLVKLPVPSKTVSSLSLN